MSRQHITVRRRPLNEAIFEVVKISPSCVWIADLTIDQSVALYHRSVTNDAFDVVRRLYKQFGNKRFLYQDTMGNWDELVHDNGQFVEFKPARGQEPGRWATD